MAYRNLAVVLLLVLLAGLLADGLGGAGPDGGG